MMANGGALGYVRSGPPSLSESGLDWDFPASHGMPALRPKVPQHSTGCSPWSSFPQTAGLQLQEGGVLISHLCEKGGDSKHSDRECSEQLAGGWLWGEIASFTTMMARTVITVMTEKEMLLVEGGDGWAQR